MKPYADTSFLASLYIGKDSNHTTATTTIASCSTALRLPFTSFGMAELLNAFSRMEYRGIMRAAETQVCIKHMHEDMGNGVLEERPLRADEWMLATQDIAKNITPSTGIRTLDAMHIAMAKIHGADTILSFDKNQRLAAQVAGFALLPASI